MPNRANPVRCQITIATRDDTDRLCNKSVPTGQQYTCYHHRKFEPLFLDPPRCRVCHELIPAVRTKQTFICNDKCRSRESSENAGFASRGPRCDRCQSPKTWLTTGLHYQCEICGYASDMPDRASAAFAGNTARAPKEIVHASRVSVWRREILEKWPKPEQEYLP